MTSSVDSRGIVNALFANSSITYDQAIKELYHNSDDANATEFHVHLVEKDYLLIRDDGDGMDMGDMSKFLVLLGEKERGDNSHGKFNFGGKQAIMRLCQIGKEDDRSDYAALISKKKGQAAVCCVFDTAELVEKGWDNNVKVKRVDSYSVPGCIPGLLSKLGDFEHGTALFVSPNSQHKSYNEIFANSLMNMARTSFFMRLNKCKFTVSLKGETHTASFFDPLYLDDAPPEYKKTVAINLWKNGESDVVTFNDGEEQWFKVMNKRGHIARTPKPCGGGGEKVGTISMVMSNIDYAEPFADTRDKLKKKDHSAVHHMYFVKGADENEVADENEGAGQNEEDDEEKETDSDRKKREAGELNDSFEKNREVLVCRNGLVIGTMPAFGKIKRQGKQDGSIMLTCRTRLEYTASTDLRCPLDKIFGVNFNKGRINFDTMSSQMKRTFEGVYAMFVNGQTNRYNELRPKAKADVPAVELPAVASKSKASEAPAVKPPAAAAQKAKASAAQKAKSDVSAVKPPAAAAQKAKASLKTLFSKKPKHAELPTKESPKKPRHAGKKSRTKEKDVQEKLQKREGGAREVDMDGVRIDLLTDDAIIEVKNYNRRICAIGQILYYHTQFPSHKPRIHIFDSNGRRDTIFDECCKKYEIAVTYESEAAKNSIS